MIGHYLLTLCPAAEDAVLTGQMRPGDYGTQEARCLVGWAADLTEGQAGRGGRPRHASTEWRVAVQGNDFWITLMQVHCVELRYDSLCERFGTERVNAAIRNRILSNGARRTLSQPLHAVA